MTQFPRLHVLCDEWQAIAAELAALPRNVLDVDRPQSAWGSSANKFLAQMAEQSGWVYAWQAKHKREKEERNESWLNYPLIFQNNPIGRNADACPLTTKLLLERVRGINAAGFSLMKPGAEIFPHRDTTGAEFGNLAFHLGLDVPQGDQCVLLVGDERAVEQNGKVVIFDAMHKHSAFNRSDEERTILVSCARHWIWNDGAMSTTTTNAIFTTVHRFRDESRRVIVIEFGGCLQKNEKKKKKRTQELASNRKS